MYLFICLKDSLLTFWDKSQLCSYSLYDRFSISCKDVFDFVVFIFKQWQQYWPACTDSTVYSGGSSKQSSHCSSLSLGPGQKQKHFWSRSQICRLLSPNEGGGNREEYSAPPKLRHLVALQVTGEESHLQSIRDLESQMDLPLSG